MNNSNPFFSKPVFASILIISLSLALAGVCIMTDFGQIFKISKTIVVAYFENNRWIISLSFILLLVATILNFKAKYIGNKWMVTFGVLWLLAVLGTKFITPYLMFKPQQYNAIFIPINEVSNDYVSEEESVFVLDINGIQRAYPRKNLWQPHIVGADFGDENIVLTYCVFTNLPVPYINQKGENAKEFKVLAQTNNNLLLWELNSGEIIQQINSTCEFSKEQLTPIPVMEMTYRGFKKLYPKGTVYYNNFDKPLEKILSAIFSPEDAWYGDEWMFKTSNFDDTRFPTKEQLIGISVNDSSLAIQKDLITRNGFVNVKVDNKNIALIYFPEYETIGAFDRMLNDSLVEITKDSIDVFGNTEHGKLNRVFIHNSVLWSVWVHYFPNTEILKSNN